MQAKLSQLLRAHGHAIAIALPTPASFETVEILVEAGAELFRQRRPGFTRRLRDTAVFPDFLLVDAAAEERQRRVERLAVPAAAGGRAAAAAPLGIDPLRLQQQLDGLGLGARWPCCRSRAAPGSSRPPASRPKPCPAGRSRSRTRSRRRAACGSLRPACRRGRPGPSACPKADRPGACMRRPRAPAAPARQPACSRAGSPRLPGSEAPRAPGPAAGCSWTWHCTSPLPAGSTRSSAQRSSVSDQNSHWAIDTPFSLFRSSPSCRRLPTTSSCRISSSTVLNRWNRRRSKYECMSSMMIDTSLLAFPSSSESSSRTFAGADATR